MTKEAVDAFARAWYQALDNHAPVETLLSFLAEGSEVSMNFPPDPPFQGSEKFVQWYEFVIHKFFDENHNVVSVETTLSGDTADIDVVVAWQASWFDAPPAKSKRTSMNAYQKWTVRSSTKNSYGLEVVYYNAAAKPFEYAPGFAQL